LLVAVFGLPLATPAASAATYTHATPAAPTAVSVSRSSVDLSWKAVADAPKYRIQYSTSSSMSNPTYIRVSGTRYELTGLKASTTYYFKVRVIDEEGVNLSAYSKALKVKTSSKSGYTHLSPTGLTVTGTGPTAVALQWNSRGDGIRYRVQYSTSSSMANAKYKRVTGTSTTISGLTLNKTYYFKVRVITNSGSNLSSYSPKVSAKTGYSFSAPKGLKVSDSSQTQALMSWTESAGAERYRIQVGTSASMANPVYYRYSGKSAIVPGLKAGKSYWFKIRVITPDGENLSPYSSAVKLTTPTAADRKYLAPTGLTAKAAKPGHLTTSWTSSGSGLYYQVRYSQNSNMSESKTVTTTSTSAELKNLADETQYYLQLRIVTSKNVAQSPYGTTATVTTAKEVNTPLVVASYNIRCFNCYEGKTNERTWYDRRDTVVALVKAQAPDVIGFQEAAQSWLTENGKKVSLSQFEDLINRLGSPYKLVNTARNNCVKSTTPTGCVYKDQGASKGTKIVYNSDKLTLVAEGSKQLSYISTKDNERYVAWAIFEQKASGKYFFFADTHLEHASGTSYYNLRKKQTEEIMAEIAKQNTDDLPTFLVGDFNSHKTTSPSNAPYDVVLKNGLIDPLGNYYKSTTSVNPDVLSKRIRTNYNSYNSWALSPPKSSTNVNGSYLDYMFVDPRIRTTEWETVLDLDSAGKWVGIIPSDHNMLRMVTYLPTAEG
jgi:endonuclease/exonuclease/phosphatase family metal-dependent hydrolase/fibronectin type 3 domain-containing protein